MSDWKLVGVEPDDLQAVFPFVHDWLKDIEDLTGGRLPYLELLKNLTSQKQQLWLVKHEKPEAAIITEVLTYPNVKYARVVMAIGGGNARRWSEPVINHIEKWAKAHGCDKVEIVARKGWLRLLPEYQTAYYLIEKELNNG